MLESMFQGTLLAVSAESCSRQKLVEIWRLSSTVPDYLYGKLENSALCHIEAWYLSESTFFYLPVSILGAI